MIKFEYRILEYNERKDIEREDVERVLNDYGEMGWEIDSVNNLSFITTVGPTGDKLCVSGNIILKRVKKRRRD